MKLWLRKWFYIVMTLVLLLSLCSCINTQRPMTEASTTVGNLEADNTPGQTGKPEQEGNLSADKNNITSIEAVKFAFEEAKKWKSNATLWYISPTPMFLHYDWNNTDKAASWTIGFANPDNDELVQVYIRNGAIFSIGNNTYDNVGNKRKVDCKPEYPKDCPKVSMKDAVKVAIANGAPAGVIPVNVAYDVESFGEAGTPLWMIVYRLPVSADPDKDEMQFYYVEGMTGQFVKAGYKVAGDIVERAQLTITGPNYSASSALLDQRNTVVKFLTLINEGKTVEVLAMMDATLKPDESAIKIWTGAFNAVKGFSIDSVTEDNKGNWSQDVQMFEVDITVPANEDLQANGWMEGENTMYVTLERQGDSWIVKAFSW